MSSMDLIIFPLTFSLSPSWCRSASDFEIFKLRRLKYQWSFSAHCFPCTLNFSVSRSCCLLFQNFPQLWFHHNHLSSNCFSSFLKYLPALEQRIGGFTTVFLNHHLNCLLLPHSTTISGSPLPILQGCKIHCRIPSYKWTYWLHGTYLQLKKNFPEIQI